jgi:hypothetical protein
MAQSRRYRLLELRLGQLRRRLLPKAFSPIGYYNDIQLDRARGYRLLAHAEIEAFLEERASEVVTRVFNLWLNDRKPRHTVVCLLAHFRPGEKSFATVAEAVGFCFGKFNQTIKDNNGIKQENLQKFLPPVGIDWALMDGTWLSTLNSFGTARGEVAHSSVRVHQPIDPMGEYDTVSNKILPGLKDLDSAMQVLLK